MLAKKPLTYLVTFLLAVFCLLGPGEYGAIARDETESGSFTVVVLPDTQGYVEANPEIFYSQTEWIVENRDDLNTKLVVHLGDLVENPEREIEWRRAKKAIGKVEREEIPSLLTFGNHDYTDLGTDRKFNPFNRHFPISRYEGSRYFGGSFSDDSADNVFMTFEVGGQKYLFMAVEYRPRDEVIEWANRVLERHHDSRSVLVTHSYMWPNGFLTSSGRKLWKELAGRHSGVRLILCGHVPGAGVEANYGESGNKVVQILSDYQYYPNGGNGFLRIMTFYPKEGRVEVRTYSPYLDSYKDDESNEFTVSWDSG